jgi:DHA2 family multidrug resistance protein-like MFS transporter
LAGTPPAKAGNAAAIDVTAYDLGYVLGVAVLGSVASLVYRQQLDVDELVEQGMPGSLATAAEDSLGAATAIADQAGLPALADRAGWAFTDALAVTSLVGGLVMIAVAVVVLLVTPRGFDIGQQQH